MQTIYTYPDDEDRNLEPEQTVPTSEHSATFIGTVLHCATVHATSGRFPRLAAPQVFKDIMIDTGAAHASN